MTIDDRIRAIAEAKGAAFDDAKKIVRELMAHFEINTDEAMVALNSICSDRAGQFELRE